MITFHHCGDLGDVIYSLPTIIELGGGLLQLGPGCTGPQFPMTPERFENIRPLLLEQSCIKELVFRSWPVRYNLDFFRMHFGNGLNIAQMHLKAYNLPLDACDNRWLRVPKAYNEQRNRIVFARTARHHSPGFPWRDAVITYQGVSCFVGTPEEHQAFERHVGMSVPYWPTRDCLDLARVVAGADLVVANQSLPYAIAEALKLDTVLEVSHETPNCRFRRANARYLPDLPNC